MKKVAIGTLVLSMLALVAPGIARAALVPLFRIDGAEETMMDPGQTARWTMAFRDPAGAPVLDYAIEHEKPMHLIVVSADLESFAHIHPRLEPDTGTFIADVNAPSADPDNQHLADVVTRPGPHFLFAEVKPSGGEVEQHRLTVRATGAASAQPLVPDVAGADGWVVKHLDESGQPAAAGSAYRVSMKVEAMKHDLVHITFRLEKRSAGRGDVEPDYEPVTDLSPWLGMLAHAVMIGGKGETVQDRVFRHLHSGHGDHAKRTPGQVLFMLHGEEVPSHGDYRVWLQVKHQGRVLTVPFTLRI